jgi:hypothetical protein
MVVRPSGFNSGVPWRFALVVFNSSSIVVLHGGFSWWFSIVVMVVHPTGFPSSDPGTLRATIGLTCATSSGRDEASARKEKNLI